MTDEKKDFFDTISQLIVKNLSKFKNKKIDKDTCLFMYKEIFETVVEVFEKSHIEVSNEFVNWLAQAMYDCVAINDNVEPDPNIFTKRASLKNIETKELVFLFQMLRSQPVVAAPVVEELKRRH